MALGNQDAVSATFAITADATLEPLERNFLNVGYYINSTDLVWEALVESNGSEIVRAWGEVSVRRVESGCSGVGYVA
jgi:hypothetical protein